MNPNSSSHQRATPGLVMTSVNITTATPARIPGTMITHFRPTFSTSQAAISVATMPIAVTERVNKYAR